MNFLETRWLGRTPVIWLLLPLSWLYCAVVWARNRLYDLGLLPSARLPVPVIVVGNITVGGTGKTPLVAWLAQLLKRSGYRPGIVSRGYRGSSRTWPRYVTAASSPDEVGDEPVLLARRAGCPVMVGRDRVAAARVLLAAYRCNIVISDDGLQHRRLARDIEIVVIDGVRRFGNGLCLPAGPLREPVSRLRRVDIRITRGTPQQGETGMAYREVGVRNLATGEVREVRDLGEAPLHAVAGIGNPGAFFVQLRSLGLRIQEHPFPDHHRFRAEDLAFEGSGPVIMTEKDAVKCTRFARPNLWFLAIEASPDPGFDATILKLLEEKRRG